MFTGQNVLSLFRLASCEAHRGSEEPSQPLPVCNGPGVEAAGGLVSNETEVGVVVVLVAPDAPQHTAWHGNDSPSAPLCRARERRALSGQLLVAGRFFCHAALGQNAVGKQSDGHVVRQTGRFQQHLFINLISPHSRRIKKSKGRVNAAAVGENVFSFIVSGARMECSAVVEQRRRQ